MKHLLSAVAVLCLFFVQPHRAQGSQEGDLFILVDDVLHCFDPVTGTGTPLFDEVALNISKPGYLAFDRFRGGALVYAIHRPTPPFLPRLFLVRANGQVSDLGFVGQSFAALAPTGDGRVYLLQGDELSVLDPLNQLVPVLDQASSPVTIPFAHMIYDAPSNSLVGVTLASPVGAPCSNTGDVSLVRLPLSADGKRLAGSPSCTTLDLGGDFPLGLDPLPNGKLLLASSGGDLLSLDPGTLGSSVWATPSQFGVNGAVWSPPLGKAIILDGVMNELRAFGQGESGFGQLIPTSTPPSGLSSGVSARSWMVDVNVLAPACDAFVQSIGTGLAGTGGQVPLLGIAGCPQIGTTLPMVISNARANATAVMVFSVRATSAPLFGGTLYVRPKFFATRVLGVAGLGVGVQDVPIPNDPTLIGLPFFSQAAVADSAAPQRWSMTQGLEVRVQ